MRYGIDELAAVVKERFELDPFSGKTIFLFCGMNEMILLEVSDTKMAPRCTQVVRGGDTISVRFEFE